jgi:hypothetical protein
MRFLLLMPLSPIGGPGRGTKAMFSIGQFPRITGLIIETIRLHHEKGLIAPSEEGSHVRS